MSISNTNESIHKNVAWLNTLLLAIVIFFLGRLVTQFDAVAENVVLMSRDLAIVKSTVDRHEKQIEIIQSHTKSYTNEK